MMLDAPRVLSVFKTSKDGTSMAVASIHTDTFIVFFFIHPMNRLRWLASCLGWGLFSADGTEVIFGTRFVKKNWCHPIKAPIAPKKSRSPLPTHTKLLPTRFDPCQFIPLWNKGTWLKIINYEVHTRWDSKQMGLKLLSYAEKWQITTYILN